VKGEQTPGCRVCALLNASEFIAGAIHPYVRGEQADGEVVWALAVRWENLCESCF